MAQKPSKSLIIIPSRLAATRLPNKPLLDINGKPMIQHVYERAMAAHLGPVYVAAGDQAIVDRIHGIGGKAVLTDPGLPSGSDRIWAALQDIDPHQEFDMIVNLQGDLPDIDAGTLRAILDMMQNQDADIGTAAVAIQDPSEAQKPNIVKIAMSFYAATQAQAHYFSRSPIPHGGPYWHHIGIYAYRRAALQKFISAPPGELEKREKLEQLRALELNQQIHVAAVERLPITVDTQEDIEAARHLMR